MLTHHNSGSRCCFFHIPKSGGTSLSEAICATVPLNQHIGELPAVPTRRAASILCTGADDDSAVHEDGPRCGDLFRLREFQLLTFMAHGAAFIHGHMLFSAAANKHFGGVYKYLTVLRDPIHRVISNYRASTYANFFKGNFDEYLESEVGRLHAQLNLRYFSGVADINHGKERETLEIAKSNQDKFSLIGFVDQLDLFVSQFNDLFIVKIKLRHYNSAKGKHISLSSNQISKLEKLCAEDLVLYERARRRFLMVNSA